MRYKNTTFNSVLLKLPLSGFINAFSRKRHEMFQTRKLKWQELEFEIFPLKIELYLNLLLTYGIDRHRLLQLNRIRVSGLARVFSSLLFLQRVEEQRQTVVLEQFRVHRRLRMTRGATRDN